MKKNRIGGLILSALMLTSVFAGCSDNSAPQTTTSSSPETNAPEATTQGTTAETTAKDSAASGEKMKITVTRWGEIEQNDPEYEMVQKFNAENDKNIEIVYDVIPGDGYGDRLTTSFASGEGYDVFASGEGDFYLWVDKSLAAPMDNLIANDSSFMNEMDDAIYEMGQINGSQYYLVRDYNPICLWYNKDVFDKNNVSYPTNDWSWDDLFDAARKLTVKKDDGTYESFGFNAQSWNYASLTYLQSRGYEIVSPDGSTTDGYLNNPELAQLLDEYVGFSTGDDRISPAAADIDTFGDSSAMFNVGTLAMTLNGGWAKQGLDDAGTNYGTALVPGNHESYLCASAYAISTRCKNPEAAWEVVKALTGRECTELRVKNSAAVYPTISTLLDEMKANTPEYAQGLFQQIEHSVQPVGVRYAIGNAAATAFTTAVERIIFNDGETMEILNDAVQEVMNP